MFTGLGKEYYWVFRKYFIFLGFCDLFLASTGLLVVGGQPIKVAEHSDLRSDELLPYKQGMGCRELGKNTISIQNVHIGFAQVLRGGSFDTHSHVSFNSEINVLSLR